MCFGCVWQPYSRIARRSVPYLLIVTLRNLPLALPVSRSRPTQRNKAVKVGQERLRHKPVTEAWPLPSHREPMQQLAIPSLDL